MHRHLGRSELTLDRSTREAREWIIASGERPVAIHAEVRMQHTTIVEVQQLMLAATFDTRDASAREGP